MKRRGRTSRVVEPFKLLTPRHELFVWEETAPVGRYSYLKKLVRVRIVRRNASRYRGLQGEAELKLGHDLVA